MQHKEINWDCRFGVSTIYLTHPLFTLIDGDPLGFRRQPPQGHHRQNPNRNEGLPHSVKTRGTFTSARGGQGRASLVTLYITYHFAGRQANAHCPLLSEENRLILSHRNRPPDLTHWWSLLVVTLPEVTIRTREWDLISQSASIIRDGDEISIRRRNQFHIWPRREKTKTVAEVIERISPLHIFGKKFRLDTIAVICGVPSFNPIAVN